MSEHTPGPWTIHTRFDDGAEVRAIAWCGVVCVGSSGNQSIDAAEARANAHLIAAAPDLLEACEGAVDKCRFGCTWLSYCGTCKSLLAAIAKARGK